MKISDPSPNSDEIATSTSFPTICNLTTILRWICEESQRRNHSVTTVVVISDGNIWRQICLWNSDGKLMSLKIVAMYYVSILNSGESKHR